MSTRSIASSRREARPSPGRLSCERIKCAKSKSPTRTATSSASRKTSQSSSIRATSTPPGRAACSRRALRLRRLPRALERALVRLEGLADMLHEGANAAVVAQLGQSEHPEIPRLGREASADAHQTRISVTVEAGQKVDADAGRERAPTHSEVIAAQRHLRPRRVLRQPAIEPATVGSFV